MKEFILKHKYTIVFMLTVISDFCFQFQTLLGIPPNYQLMVRTIGLFVIILLNRVQFENRIIALQTTHLTALQRKQLNVSITFWDGLVEIFKGFFTHLTKWSNLTTSNGPSHILLGGSLLFFWCTFDLPEPFISSLLLLLVGSFSAFGLGMIIEFYQTAVWKASASDQDIYNTGLGYLLFYIIGASLVYFKIPYLYFIAAGVLLAVISLCIHKPSTT